MKIIAFTKHNPECKSKHPQEDSFKYYLSKNRVIIAVADGITRDSVNNKYPNPSPAKIAADLFCNSFVDYSGKIKLNNNSVRKALENSNRKIAGLNKKNNPNPNYLENDYWACVGVGGVIANNQLYYGYITDCGIAVFDDNGRLKFRTKNEGPNTRGSIDEDILKKYKQFFKFPEGRKIIRSQYRNNPSNPLSYGALTGEKSAVEYIRTGKFKVKKGDYIIFYSDGMSPILYSNSFNISKNFNNLDGYFEENRDKVDGAEGTLVAVLL